MKNLEKMFEKEISCRSAYYVETSLSQVLIYKHLWSNWMKLQSQTYYAQLYSVMPNYDQR